MVNIKQENESANILPKRYSGLGRWLFVAIFLIVIDQFTKIGFDHALRYGQRINIWPFFDLTLLYNKGAAFSFLADQPGWQRWFFTALGLGASIFIVWMMHTHRTQHRFLFALSLILGGALGNVIDRIAYGHVIDFLLFYWRDWYYPAFNIADTGITVGAILLVIDEILRLRGQHARSS
ncbi:signal peptidase II [Zwartia panacis]|jgi:signal peptidase II|uniref:signal peptidase II n=1 Tax=Zwartia panacis TaxID=2683345 RepID=UPI0025B2C9D2|nr:signal peptidase II [Zwartia panacis]MDN4016934.1 signal peptidase II [Zwartia panacis]